MPSSAFILMAKDGGPEKTRLAGLPSEWETEGPGLFHPRPPATPLRSP